MTHESDKAQKAFTLRHYAREAVLVVVIVACLVAGKIWGGTSPLQSPLQLGPVPLDFLLFGGMLIMIAVSSSFKLEPRDIAVSGLGIIMAYHLTFGQNMVAHLSHEAKELGNLACLLLGFAIMAKLFEQSRIADKLPAVLPDDWRGGFVLLAFVFLMSAFLDNIASAMIGGVVAKKVYHGKVRVGFLAAIVAASNGGGAFSVVGDTTTTMMWIAKVVSPIHILSASAGSIIAFLCFAIPASVSQDRFQRIQKDENPGTEIHWSQAMSVFSALIGAVLGNVFLELPGPGVFVGLLVGSFFVKEGFPWKEWRHVSREAVFIMALVCAATLMPVKSLPTAGHVTAFGLGALSACFDNIPLTALAIKQGGYDWPLLAYGVGFGGSMFWFGSSAGVALCSNFPEGKNLWAWVTQGWPVIIGYVVGFWGLAAYLELDHWLGDRILFLDLTLLLSFCIAIYAMMQKPWRKKA